MLRFSELVQHHDKVFVYLILMLRIVVVVGVQIAFLAISVKGAKRIRIKEFHVSLNTNYLMQEHIAQRLVKHIKDDDVREFCAGYVVIVWPDLENVFVCGNTGIVAIPFQS